MNPPESTKEHIDSTRKCGIVCASFLRADALVDVCEQFTSETVTDGEPEELYKKGDSKFEFQRCISRLHEMRSKEYL